MIYTVKIDFQKDFIDMLNLELSPFNISIDPTIKFEDALLRYFNFKKRQVQPRNRSVLKSSVFTCPSAHFNGLQSVIDKLSNGDDISMHLSRKLYDLDYHDPLLNDWGIYHLHLGELLESDGFINRTGPLLFARFDNDHAYLINVMEHGSWTDQDMLKVLHNHWPDSIRNFRMEDTRLEHVPTNSNIALARKHGITMLTEIEGVPYMPMGGGVTTAKTSIEVAMQALDLGNNIKHAEDLVLAKIQELGNTLANKHNFSGTEIDFRLRIVDNVISAVEPTTGVAFGIIDMNRTL